MGSPNPLGATIRSKGSIFSKALNNSSGFFIKYDVFIDLSIQISFVSTSYPKISQEEDPGSIPTTRIKINSMEYQINNDYEFRVRI